MSGIDKVAATALFQTYGLEALPARVYEARDRPTASMVRADFPQCERFVVRTASREEARNLPRLAGASSTDAADWICQLAPDLSVVIQPFDEVLFSVELMVHDGMFTAEIVPGIWELDNWAVPVTVRLEAGDARARVAAPSEAQDALFVNLAGTQTRRTASVASWQINATVSWITQHRTAIFRLGDETGLPIGIKLHYAPRYGLSPQNIRTAGLPETDEMESSSPGVGDLVRVDSLTTPIPPHSRVLLTVGVARESAALLDDLIARLKYARVEAVYVMSGLLSHLAINLREAGLIVRAHYG